jgi:hypothetical protein
MGNYEILNVVLTVRLLASRHRLGCLMDVKKLVYNIKVSVITVGILHG